MRYLLIIITIILAACSKNTLPEIEVDPSDAELYFPPISGSEWETVSAEDLNWNLDTFSHLVQFLEESNTRAFILLKNGKIVFEEYFDKDLVGLPFDKNSYWYWASAGKTLTSFLVGKAQEEDFLDINDSSSKYLGKRWTSLEEDQEAKIKILHQLTMTSGLDDTKDPYCTEAKCLTYKDVPGNRWAYHNAPYTLLKDVVEGATNQRFDDYFNEVLRNPIGMNGYWTYIDYNHVFFSNARSMARFGLLMLNNGDWGDTEILRDKSYISASVNSSQDINLAYGYLWWLNGKSKLMIPGLQLKMNKYLTENAPGDMYAAIGKNGQLLNVVPSENLVMIRMGENPDISLVPLRFQEDLWTYLSHITGRE